MITNFFLNIFYGLIYAITSPLRLLADVSLPAGITSAISSSGSYLTIADYFFPIATFLAIIAAVIAVDAFIVLFKIFNWVIRKIPTVN